MKHQLLTTSNKFKWARYIAGIAEKKTAVISVQTYLHPQSYFCDISFILNPCRVGAQGDP
jgi:hypothetical protein